MRGMDNSNCLALHVRTCIILDLQCWSFTIKLQCNKSFRKKSIPSGGQLNVAINRHWVTCVSKLGVEGDFSSFFGPSLSTLFVPSL